ncbi:MAG: adaptor protein MecA [Oscillospiraceae bacterium]
MTFEQSDKNQLVAKLSSEEMYETGLAYALAYNNEYMVDVISNILLLGKQKINFKTKQSRIAVEIIKKDNFDCEIKFNIMPSYKLENNTIVVCEPIIFAFENLDNLISASISLFNNYCKLVYHSTLFFMDNKYYLIINSTNDTKGLATNLLLEYGDLLGKGEIAASFPDEYGKLLIKNNAIDKLAYYFKGA